MDGYGYHIIASMFIVGCGMVLWAARKREDAKIAFLFSIAYIVIVIAIMIHDK